MKKTASFGLSALLLAGCVSVLPEPVVPDALFRFQADKAALNNTPISLPVGVTIYEPEGSALLLGRSVVFENANGELKVIGNAQWSDPASRLFQSLLINRLSDRNNGAEGQFVTDRSGARTPVELKWRVRDFVIHEGEARCSVRVTLLGARNRVIVSQFDLSETVVFKGKNNIAGVQALNQCAGQVVDQVVTTLPSKLDQAALEAVSRRR